MKVNNSDFESELDAVDNAVCILAKSSTPLGVDHAFGAAVVTLYEHLKCAYPWFKESLTIPLKKTDLL